MIAFYKNSDIQKWFEAKNMPKSNSTQNDEIEVDGETYVKWDTQNDWDGELYKVACHIHAESMAYKVGMAGSDDPEMGIYKRLKTLLADARREVIEKVEKMGKPRFPLPDDPRKITERYERAREYEVWKIGYNKAIEDVLATLKEETL